ncbi:hypothetical protein Msil_3078 [Methylocella silvestris BL2]|uniref:Uncharacterized protein n=1 Tax=Methylocella silvestris (strain DSM 15510 / CIP 108128 / LMG 27833 / NCIMB 13906 / BL2) TaxID=395965 RepID=B8EKV9_METSB|nr:hypothetical protein [Methylocella silvestris]ACK51987.1 hypothetical protein Msil_3078 [Methylocella silvestris BL2]
MPNDTVPAAAKGLPNSDINPPSGLAETASGLAVVRSKDFRALRPSVLSGEELAKFLKDLDAYVAADQQEEHLDRTVSPRRPREEYVAARLRIRGLRRVLNKPLKKIRAAKSTTIDDILFKASLAEIVDNYECWGSTTLGHSIVNDLLSAACEWRA